MSNQDKQPSPDSKSIKQPEVSPSSDGRRDEKAQINEGVIDSDRGWEPKKGDRKDESNKDDKKDSK